MRWLFRKFFTFPVTDGLYYRPQRQSHHSGSTLASAASLPEDRNISYDDQATSLQRQTIMHQWEIYKRAIKINIRITREPDDTIYKSLRSLGSSIRRQILFSTLRIQTFPRLHNTFAF
ncbi:hypothetical protein TWF132_003694 [Orbilia oligospora]|nr:hypothetical protein TWF132_003694 [Orbilia oligospora]